MSIRIYNGQWLLAGYNIATSGDCCCGDGPDQGPCESCLDTCFCVHLQGHNFCDGSYLEVTDCSGTFANCTQEIWQANVTTGQYFYTRNEYGPIVPGQQQFKDIYGVGFNGLPTACSEGQWTAPGLSSFAEEGRNDLVNPVRRTEWEYATHSIVTDSFGCPISVNPGGYSELSTGFPPTQDIQPLTPSITFTRCPPDDVAPLALSAGAGDELKALLATFGIKAGPKCKCNEMARKMNAWGPSGSLDHIEEIVDAMEKAAKARRLPFLRAAGRKLVQIACRRAARKLGDRGIS